jgi:hypothetical protein
MTRTDPPVVGKCITKEMRHYIYERDGKACRICGLHRWYRFSQMVVHHIDRNRAHNDPSNLVTLCAHCHSEVHRDPMIAEALQDILDGLYAGPEQDGAEFVALLHPEWTYEPA